MIVSNLAIDRWITVFALLVLITIGGVYSYTYLPREADPEIIIPIITISTSYGGVAPTDIETLVTTPIERKLTGLDGVKEITSSSMEGLSSITIEFEPDINIDDALQRVGDKVDLATGDLPGDTKKPVIREVNLAELPMMSIALSGGTSLAQLSGFAESIEDRIEAIPGVLDVDIVGKVEREIQVEVDPLRLAQYGISLPTLTNLLLKENVNTPAGTMDLGSAKYITRVPGEFHTPEELGRLVAKPGVGKAVYLRDVASVRDGFKDVQSISRVNDIPSITLTVAKRSGENIIGISERVHALVAELRGDFPEGVTLTITMDKSTEIKDMVTQLESSILTGLILVLVVIFLFMGMSNAIFVSLAIPVSLLITFIILALLGVTLNMVVLFSLTLCLGMLVDNAIVVVENIYRYRQQGVSPLDAAKLGAGEVAVPIIASTITTLAAFIPLFFWPGIMGSYMEYLPITVTITLSASLFVGLVINPALVSVFIKRSPAAPEPHSRRHSYVLDGYTRVLKFALRWRAASVVLAITVLVMVSVMFFSDAEIEFMPETEPFRADIDINAPEGTNLATSDDLVKQVETVVRQYGDRIDFVVSKVGSGSEAHASQVTLRFPKELDAVVPPTATLNQIRRGIGELIGAEVLFSQESYGPRKSSALSIELSGADFDELLRLSNEVRSIIGGIPGLTDLDDDFEMGRPEIRVNVAREEAWLAGMDTQAIGLSVKAAIEGVRAGQYREGDEEYDVTVQFPSEFKQDLGLIESMTLVNAKGDAIPFSSVATIEQGVGMGSIQHINRKRTITVLGRAEGRPSTEVVADAKRLLAGFNLPHGYTLSFTGENKDRNDTQGFLFIAFFVGLILITIVLIAQFNSVLQSLMIMSSVILSLAGVFLGLMLFDLPFGIFMTGLGCISLAGVVVNNAIVLMDFVNQERKRGASAVEAVLHAGRTRFRPVILTAITTILGLIPMAVGISFDLRSFTWLIGGTSSQFWGSMAVAIIFGLSFATVLTLIVIPVLYCAGDSFNESFRRSFNAQSHSGTKFGKPSI